MTHSPMANYDESERADYMCVVANIAHADSQMTPEEAFILREMCLHFVLGPTARGRVLAYTVQSRDELEPLLSRLSQSDLRFALLADLYVMALVDSTLQEQEQKEIAALAERVGVDSAKLEALRAFSQNACASRLGGSTSCDTLPQALKKLEGAGVPACAVEISAASWLITQKESVLKG